MSVIVRYSRLERILFPALPLLLPLAVGSGLAFSPDDPGPARWIALAGLEIVFVVFAVSALRFVFTADDRELLHREFVTKRIPLEAVRRVRVTRTVRGGFIRHTRIEIEGGNRPMVVEFRRGPMAPMVRFLVERLPAGIVTLDEADPARGPS